MGVIGTIIIGLFVGLVAHFVKTGNDQTKVIPTILVGIVGAFAGRFIGQTIGIYSSNQPAGFIGAVLGAVLILTLLKTTKSKTPMAH